MGHELLTLGLGALELEDRVGGDDEAGRVRWELAVVDKLVRYRAVVASFDPGLDLGGAGTQLDVVGGVDVKVLEEVGV